MFPSSLGFCELTSGGQPWHFRSLSSGTSGGGGDSRGVTAFNTAALQGWLLLCCQVADHLAWIEIGIGSDMGSEVSNCLLSYFLRFILQYADFHNKCIAWRLVVQPLTLELWKSP